MPARSLLDLPPELIEQIFEQHELLVHQDQVDAGEGELIVPVFRLTNRHIERCTRPAFTKTYYRVWQVKPSDDTSVREFSAMAQIPDLARCVEELIVYAENDDAMVVHETASSQTEISLPNVKNVADASRPLESTETTRRRSTLVSALRTCFNIKELAICPTPQKYDPGFPGEAQPTIYPQNPEARKFLFDTSSSFAYALSLTEEADIFPILVSTSSNKSDPDNMLSGLTAFPQAANALCKLENLELVVVQERVRPGEARVDQCVSSKLTVLMQRKLMQV